MMAHFSEQSLCSSVFSLKVTSNMKLSGGLAKFSASWLISLSHQLKSWSIFIFMGVFWVVFGVFFLLWGFFFFASLPSLLFSLNSHRYSEWDTDREEKLWLWWQWCDRWQPCPPKSTDQHKEQHSRMTYSTFVGAVVSSIGSSLM